MWQFCHPDSFLLEFNIFGILIARVCCLVSPDTAKNWYLDLLYSK